MKGKKGGDLICKRPETIVEARFSLTKKQNDIMDMVFASITDDEKLEYEIDISKYAKLYKLKNKSNIYSDCKKAAESFEGKGFKILNKEKKRGDYFPWFARITYLDGESRIQVELGKTLKQLFLEVKRACFYNIEYTLNFKSIYSQRLYYYLKTFEDTGFRVDNLEELKKKLVCPPSYKNYADFKRFVMNPAYEDINGNSDMNFEYEPIKTGRKVTNLKFYIKTNKIKQSVITIPLANEEISATSEENDEENLMEKVKDIIKNTTNIQINSKSANEIYKNALKHVERGNVPLELIREVAEYSKTQNIKKGFVGWFKITVENYQKPVKSIKKGSFNDYEQRKYDLDALEKKLLGWDNEN